MISKAKCSYVTERIEELRNVYVIKHMYIDEVYFEIKVPHLNEALVKVKKSALDMQDSADELVYYILQVIDNKGLDLIKKA